MLTLASDWEPFRHISPLQLESEKAKFEWLQCPNSYSKFKVGDIWKGAFTLQFTSENGKVALFRYFLWHPALLTTCNI
jgi:hypothetical protein